jgi:surface protein
MKKNFKVNLEEFKDDLKLFLDFIKRNKNKIKIIHNNKITSLENEIITKNSKIKFILSNNPFNYQMKYNLREMEFEEEDEHEKDMNKDKNIKIFGKHFVENNYSKCFIMYKNIIFPLKEYFSSKYLNIEKDNKLKIKLISFENISDFSYIFDECKSLEDFSFYQFNENNIIKEKENENDIIKKNENKNISTNEIKEDNNPETVNDDKKYNDFYGENNEYLDNISIIYNDINENISFSSYNIFKESHSYYWNIKDTNKLVNYKNFNTIINIIDMNHMFEGCSSLKSLPDISKWNTNNVTNMSYMFNGCSSLISLPNISKWNTNNVTDMNCMFYACSSLISLPDISKWNINNVTYMSSMFNKCLSLITNLEILDKKLE